MDYAAIYNNIIERAKGRVIEGYVERHHIIPRCMGGDNNSNNLVKLTAREHYICHLLLVKMYPNERKLIYAAHMMSVTTKSNLGRSQNRRYEWIRMKHAEQVSKDRKGKRGYKQTEEHKLKGKISRTGLKRTPESRERLSKALKGRPKSDEHKRKISEASKLRIQRMTPEERKSRYDKVSASLVGRTVSEETRKKISDARKRVALAKKEYKV